MEDELRLRLEEADIEPAVIDEVLQGVDKMTKAHHPIDGNANAVEDQLKIALNNTVDWRRKAQIAAQIISNYYKDS